MPWSSDEKALVKKTSRVKRATMWIVPLLFLAWFGYWTAVFFVTVDCESSIDDHALTFCPTAIDTAWIGNTTKFKLLKRLANAQIGKEKYEDALLTLTKIAAHEKLGFNELTNRFTALYFLDRKSEALIDMKAALALRPGDISTTYDIAKTALELGDVVMARSSYNAILLSDPSQIDVLLALGRLEYDEKNTNAALGLARRALAIESGRADANNLMALAFELDGKVSEALDYYSRAIAGDKANAVYLTNRAMLHYDQDNYIAARADYQASLAIERRYDNVLGLALVELEEKDVEPAKPLLDEALKLNADGADAYAALGRYHIYEDQFPEARTALNKAKEIWQEFPRADYWIATLNYNENKLEEALKGYLSVLPTWPNSTVVELDIAHTLLDLGRDTEAATHFDRAIELDPTFSRAWEGRARLNIWLGSWDKGIADATEAIRNDGNRGSSYARRGYAYWWKDNEALALADFNQAVALSPETVWIATDRADFLASRGHPAAEQAIAELKSRKVDPTEIHRIEGRLAEAKNNMPAAIASYRKALAISPNNVWRQEDLAWNLIYNNDYLEALAACEKMLAIDPKQPAGHRCRSRAYRQMQNYELALEAINAALAMDRDYDIAGLDKALILLAMSRHSESIEVLTPLIRKDYRPEFTRYYRALAQIELQNSDLAIRDLEKALETATGSLAKDISTELNRARSKTGIKPDMRNIEYPQLRTQQSR
jgi:tetratricopeptide (TPR) repeat protein